MIQIHFPSFIAEEQAQRRFNRAIQLPQGWMRTRISFPGGSSPVLYARGSLSLLPNWTDLEVRTFLVLMGGSTIALELPEEREHEIISSLESRSLDPASPVG